MATKTESKQSNRSRSSGGNNGGGATRRDSEGRFTSERSAFSWGGGNAGVLAGAAIAGAAVGIAANFGRKFLMQMPAAAAGDWFDALKAEAAVPKLTDLYDPCALHERLEIVAQHGYPADSGFIRHFLEQGFEPACDVVRRQARRMIIEDVANFPPLAGTIDRDVSLADDVRATCCTPMVTRPTSEASAR